MIRQIVQEFLIDNLIQAEQLFLNLLIPPLVELTILLYYLIDSQKNYKFYN